MAFEENIGEASIDVRLDTKRLAGDLARARRQIKRSLGQAGMVGGDGGEGGGTRAGGGGSRPGRAGGGAPGTSGAQTRQVGALRGAVKKLNRANQNLSKSFGQVKRSIPGRIVGRAIKNFNTLTRRFRVAAFTAGTLLAALISLRTEIAALSLAAAGFALNIGLDKARDQMDAFSASTAQLRGRMDAIRRVATETGQRFTAIADGAGMLAARGMAAGRSFESMLSTVRGVSKASASLGRSGSDTNKTLEEFSEFAKTGEVSISDLRDAISFMPNELRVLSNALNQPIPLIRAWIEEGNTLSSRVLPDVAKAMGNAENDTGSLASSFNKLWNAFTALLEVFNRSGVIDAARSTMAQFTQMLQSSGAEDFMRMLGQRATEIINQMPQFAQSIISNWQKILRYGRTLAGVLIGGAAGGIPGGILGGIIGSHRELLSMAQEVGSKFMGLVGRIVNGSSKFGDAMATAIKTAVDALSSLFENPQQAFARFKDALSTFLADTVAEAVKKGFDRAIAGVTGGSDTVAEQIKGLEVARASIEQKIRGAKANVERRRSRLPGEEGEGRRVGDFIKIPELGGMTLRAAEQRLERINSELERLRGLRDDIEKKDKGGPRQTAAKDARPLKTGQVTGRPEPASVNLIDRERMQRSLDFYKRTSRETQQISQQMYENYRNFVLQSTEATLGAISEISTQLVNEGEVAWQQLADSIISQLIRIQTKLLIVKPLMDAMRGGGGQGSGGAASLLKMFGMSLAGSAGGGLYSTGAVSDPTYAPNMYSSNPGTVPGAASGGVITEPGTIYTQNGGAVNIAEKGSEAIVPLDKMNGGGGGMKVEIINENGSQIDQEQRTGPNGEQIMRAIVRDEMASDFARRGNAFRTLERSTNIKRRGRNGG